MSKGDLVTVNRYWRDRAAMEIVENGLRKEENLRHCKTIDSLTLERDALAKELAVCNKVLRLGAKEVCEYQKEGNILREQRGHLLSERVELKAELAVYKRALGKIERSIYENHNEESPQELCDFAEEIRTIIAITKAKEGEE